MDEQPSTSSSTSKKRKDDKFKRRDPRSIDNLKKTLHGLSDPEKLELLEEKYEQLYNENRTLTATVQAHEKQISTSQKKSEKERSELEKCILSKGQLESLCRELQKQNRLIKEENVARIKEEEDRRREVANTFTERLNALTNLITESKDKSNKVREENQSMTDKLTELYQQYQQRENHVETVTRQLELQKKLAETQAKKVEIEHEAERQTFLAQKKNFETQMGQYEKEIVLLQEKNQSLEAQVELYKSQYSDFEITMSKSNKVFDTFKQEMSRMSKQLHTLELERNDIRKRWQSSVNSLIVLSEQHMSLANEQGALEKRLAMLQKLCRQLQEDRSAFLKQLKEHNIEPFVPSLQNNENNASEQNVEASKSAQRALRLKQELGKVKEVASMINKELTEKENPSILAVFNKDLTALQKHINASEHKIDALLEGSKAIKKHRRDASEATNEIEKNKENKENEPELLGENSQSLLQFKTENFSEVQESSDCAEIDNEIPKNDISFNNCRTPDLPSSSFAKNPLGNPEQKFNLNSTCEGYENTHNMDVSASSTSYPVSILNQRLSEQETSSKIVDLSKPEEKVLDPGSLEIQANNLISPVNSVVSDESNSVVFIPPAMETVQISTSDSCKDSNE